MTYDPDYYRNPKDFSRSPIENLKGIKFTEEERAIAKEMIASDELEEEEDLQPVDPRCLKSLNDMLRNEANPEAREEELPYLNIFITPNLENCPIYADPGIIRGLGDDVVGPPIPVSSRINEGPFSQGNIRCSWYRPYHLYQDRWGIVVRIRCVIALTQIYCRAFDPAHLGNLHPLQAANEFFLLAGATLRYREFYRHKVEAFGFRIREVETSRRPGAYLLYLRDVQRGSAQGKMDRLEDALAVAAAYRHIYSKYKTTGFHAELTRSASGTLIDLLNRPECPPNYTDGLWFLEPHAHKVAERELMQRVWEARNPTTTCGAHWRFTSGMMGSLISLSTVPIWQV